MTSQPIEANVVLSSDNSQYDRSMVTSAQNTDQLGQSVDSLGVKISNLSKTAGKTLIGISAADVATIGGATAAWSSYEKQVSRLQAQSAILTRTTSQQNQLMKDYTSSVKGLRMEFGTTTAEAASLVTTLSKITTVSQSSDLKNLSKIFVQMSNATGESSDGLANSLTSLQKVMGTPINSIHTKKYADQFTYLAAQTNTSAQSLIDFTTQLAPIGRSIGMTQSQVTGFATAFARAGQDGLGVSSVFTKVATDISKSLATGSPEIAHYANLIGVTNKKFKEMDGADQFIAILNALHKMGPRAATELDRLGLDGPRALKSIQAVINQSGGIREALGLVQEGAHSDATAKGSAAATDNLSKKFAILRQETMRTAEVMGSYFNPVIEKFVTGLTFADKIVQHIAEGPLGKFLGLVMGIVAPLAAGAGAILLFAGTLIKLASAFTLLRSSASYGIREGLGGAPGIVRGPDGFAGSGGAVLGTRGSQIAERGSFLQRWQYNTGQMAGGGIRGIMNAGRGGYDAARGFVDPDYVPARSRGVLSYLAGGVGRGLQMANPLFDQMRYADPTKRSQYLDQLSPFSKLSDRIKLSGHMGDVALAQTQLGQVASEQQRVTADPLLTNQERTAKMDALKTVKEETAQRLSSAQAAETATRSSIAATQVQTKEVRDSTTGFTRLTRGLGGTVAGMGGGLMGAGRAGIMSVAKSPMAMPLAGMMGMGVLSATGVQSNMMMMGAMGSMMGPEGAIAGALIGASIDISKSNSAVATQLKDYGAQAAAVTKAGYGFSDLATTGANTQALMSSTAQSQAVGSRAWWLGNPSISFGATKNSIMDLFGKSQHQQNQEAYDASHAQSLQAQGTARDLAAATGTKIKGTAANQLKQLDAFMSNEGAQALSDAGIDPATLIAARTAMINGGGPKSTRKYQNMVDRIASGGNNAMDDRVATTDAGAAMEGSAIAQKAIRFQANVGLFYSATTDIFDKLRKSGSSYIDILHSTEMTQSKVGDDNNRKAELQAAVMARAQQALQYQLPLMSRAQGFQQTIDTNMAIQSGIPSQGMTPNQAAALESSKTAVASAFTDQVEQIKQALLIQDEYNINRQRSEAAFALQQSYQLHDYNLQRNRAEFSFNRSRDRATADYYRSVRRANYDFNLQRTRQEQDFEHQNVVAAKQAAMSVYDIYQRVETQRTTAASALLANAGDQLKRMQEQEANLNTLRKRGLSDSAIQQLKLTDPANAQELNRLMAELTPKMIKQFNQVAGKERVKAAGALVDDPSSLDRKELLRAYNRARNQALADHSRQLQLGRQDFERQLHQQKIDFDLLLSQQNEDYNTMVKRQESAYQLSMEQAAQDLARMGKEITGSINDILTQGTQSLTGNMQRQAAAALTTFHTLRSSTRPVAIAMMKDLSDIFGFDYKVPKMTPVNNPSPTGPHHGGPQDPPPGVKDGGIMPGWTPGRDTLTAHLSGGEAIMRPEWARAVGEGAINAMNHRAKHGGFAEGGVYRPINEPVSRGLHDQWTGYSAVDLAAPVGTPVYAVNSGRISRSYDIAGPLSTDSYHNAAYGPYGSYGRVMYLKTDLGPEVVYAHLSTRGYIAGTRVHGGEPIGASGSSGNSSGPHLHFGDSDGNPMEFINRTLAAHGHLKGFAASGLFTGVSSTIPTLAQITKRRYAKPEEAALAMLGVHPLDPGNISDLINAMTKARYKESLAGVNPHKKHTKWYGEGSVFTGPHTIGIGENGPEAVIPLDDRGAEFLAKVMRGVESRGLGMGSHPMGNGTNIYNTRIDKSTNFTGPISVHANDPNALIKKLQARQRVMALSRPSLTGSSA